MDDDERYADEFRSPAEAAQRAARQLRAYSDAMVACAAEMRKMILAARGERQRHGAPSRRGGVALKDKPKRRRPLGDN